MSNVIDKLKWEFSPESMTPDWESDRHRYSLFANPEQGKKEKNMAHDYYDTSLWDGYGGYGNDLTVSKSKGKPSAPMKRCYHTHPPLPLEDGLVMYGGSCNSPSVKDADVYIGFDHGMSISPKSFPWNEGCEIKFKITDGSAPTDVKEFKKLVEWSIEQIRNGKKVHAGCIGGHGRTGTFLAALVTVMTGEADSITYVREHYCKKAVESQTQVDWLNKHFGIKKAKPSRSWGGQTKVKTYAGTNKGPKEKDGSVDSPPRGIEEYTHISDTRSIWGKNTPAKKY